MKLRTLLLGGVGLAAAVGAWFLVPALIAANPEVSQPFDDGPAVEVVAQAAPQSRRQPSLPVDDGFDPFAEPATKTPLNPIPESQPFGDRPDPLALPISAPSADDPPVDAAAVDPAPLRQELLALLNEKVDLLSVPQLQAAILRTEQEIRELKAQDRLERLRHELDRLGREYPSTWGGEAARKLLQVPLLPMPTFEPRPGGAASERSDDPRFPSDPGFAPTAQPGRTF